MTDADMLKIFAAGLVISAPMTMQYKPIYTVQKQNGRILFLRKLEPFERHYYKTNEYICDGINFWLVLESSKGG